MLTDTPGEQLTEQTSDESVKLALMGPVGPSTSPGYKKSIIQLHERIEFRGMWSSDLFTTLPISEFTEDGYTFRSFQDLAEEKYSLAVISGVWFPSVLRAARSLRKLKIPYVISPRGALSASNLKFSWYKKFPFLAFGGLRYLNQAEALHYLNEDEKKNSWLPKRSLYVSNTLCCGEFELPKHSYTRQSNGIIFGFIGRYAVHHKGLDRMVKAFAKLLKKKPEAQVQLILHGQGTGRTRVERMVGRLGLNDVVDIRGAIQGDDKTAFLQQCDVFCHTSRYEGQPQAVMEAMAASCAILVTPGANMSEYVRSYKCGTVSDGSPAAIAEAMLELVNDRERLHSMGQRARTAAEESFEPSRLDHELDALLPFMIGTDDRAV